MIVVNLEMWPGGDETKKRLIGRTYIYNCGGTDERGNYQVRVCKKGKYEPTRDIIAGKGCTRTGEVFDYPRLSYNVWRLIIRALKSCFTEEK